MQDSEVHNQMAERLLDMVWQLTMPADAPPELLEADAMTEVLRQYEGGQVRLCFGDACTHAPT